MKLTKHICKHNYLNIYTYNESKIQQSNSYIYFWTNEKFKTELWKI